MEAPSANVTSRRVPSPHIRGRTGELEGRLRAAHLPPYVTRRKIPGSLPMSLRGNDMSPSGDLMPTFVRSRSRILAGMLASLLVALPAVAVAQIPASEFAARRDSLAGRVQNGVVVAFGGRTPVSDFGPFYQLPAFHYLTNFDEPDAAFVMLVQNGRGTSTLFLTPVGARKAFYYGRRPDSTTVVRDLGVHTRAFSALAAYVDSLAR